LFPAHKSFAAKASLFALEAGGDAVADWGGARARH